MVELTHIWHNLQELLTYQKDVPMLFSSGIFWLLLLLFIPIYACLKRRRWQMIAFVVAFSLYFYYKSSGFFFLLLVGTSLFDWSLSRIMTRLNSNAAKRLFESNPPDHWPHFYFLPSTLLQAYSLPGQH